MKALSSGLIIGVSIGVVIGVLLASCAFFCFRIHSKRSHIGNSSSRRAANIPIRANGADSCTVLSDSCFNTTDSPTLFVSNSGMSSCLGGLKKANVLPASGILEYNSQKFEDPAEGDDALVRKFKKLNDDLTSGFRNLVDETR